MTCNVQRVQTDDFILHKNEWSELITTKRTHVTSSAGRVVNEKIIERTVREFMPFMATENLLMEAVKRGGDRQQLHEIIRKCSMEATARMKNGEDCDLLSRLAAEPAFRLTEAEMKEVLDPSLYIGRSAEQVDTLIAKVKPLISDLDGEVASIEL